MKKLIVSVFLVLSVCVKAQIGIDNPIPDAKALIDMQSTNKGLLIPRVTTGERISLGAGAPESLMVYDIELHAFFFYYGGWKCITPWTLTIATATSPMPDMNSNNALVDAIGINENPGAGEKLAVGGDVRVTGAFSSASVSTSGNISSSGTISATGNITSSANVISSTFSSVGAVGLSGPVPTGGVIMWSGSLANFDGSGKGTGTMTGWALCNGSNGTPNLRGRFVVGHDPANTDYDNITETGGSESVTLSKAQMPVHNHTGSTSTGGSHDHKLYYEDTGIDHGSDGDMADNIGPGDYGQSGWTEYSGNHSHTLTINNEGGGAAHENRPPYLVLAYIMKL